MDLTKTDQYTIDDCRKYGEEFSYQFGLSFKAMRAIWRQIAIDPSATEAKLDYSIITDALGTATGAAIGTALFPGIGTAAGKAIGKASGKMLGKVAEMVDVQVQLNSRPNVIKFLSLLEDLPEDVKVDDVLRDVSFTIFCSYNMQLYALLKDHGIENKNGRQIAMAKFGSDAVFRIFDHLEKNPITFETAETFRDKLLMCFLHGTSTKYGKSVTQTMTRMVKQTTGRHIELEKPFSNREKSEVLTSSIFEKPDVLDGNGHIYITKPKAQFSKYYYHHRIDIHQTVETPNVKEKPSTATFTYTSEKYREVCRKKDVPILKDFKKELQEHRDDFENRVKERFKSKGEKQREKNTEELLNKMDEGENQREKNKNEFINKMDENTEELVGEIKDHFDATICRITGLEASDKFEVKLPADFPSPWPCPPSLPETIINRESDGEYLTKTIMRKLSAGNYKPNALAIWGMGGNGKTTLSSLFIKNYSEFYCNIVRISCEAGESSSEKRQSLCNNFILLYKQLFAKDLDYNKSDNKLEDAAISTVLRMFNNVAKNTKSKVLFVFDDVYDSDTIQKISKDTKFFTIAENFENLHILITSRYIDWTIPKMEILSFTTNETINYFKRSLGEVNKKVTDDDLKQLSSILYNLPLAVAQAAAYISALGFSVKEYIKAFSDNFEYLFGGPDSTTFLDNNERTVMSTFTMTLEYLNNPKNPAGECAEWILEIVALGFPQLFTWRFIMRTLCPEDKDFPLQCYDQKMESFLGGLQLPDFKKLTIFRIRSAIRSAISQLAKFSLLRATDEIAYTVVHNDCHDKDESCKDIVSYLGKQRYDSDVYRLQENHDISMSEEKYTSITLHPIVSKVISEISKHSIMENRASFQEVLTSCRWILGDLLAADNDGDTTFNLSCLNNNLVNVKQKIAEAKSQGILGMLKNKGDNEGRTPLWCASQEGHVDIVDVLLQCDADVNCANKNGATPLYKAIQKNHPLIVTKLLENGADVNLAKNNGVTPLFIASQNNHLLIVTKLLENGADVNLALNDGTTPLYIASQKNNTEIGKILLAWNASVDQEEEDGFTPLMIAAEKGSYDTTAILLQNGADVFKKNKENTNSAYFAAQWGNLDVMKLLISQQPSVVSTKGFKNFTMLHAASQNNHHACIQELMKSPEIGKIINDKANNFGHTPLTTAVQNNGDVETVKMLVENGGDPKLSGYQDKKPLQWAEEKQKLDISTYLKSL